MNIIVTEYDEKWPLQFKEEATKLKMIYGAEILEIHHIGSTSVPGMIAKPVIDIMPVVRDIRKVDAYNEQMIELGYEPLGENGIKQRRFFRKGRVHRTHHVHIFQFNNHLDIDRHVAVRCYLQQFPEVARLYGALKAKLAKEFPLDRVAYIEGKDHFVTELEKKALKWYRTL
ncbi:MAG: GrpB family protein [Firmicutes bacterium]|nr:GrpB family protein [Bacillota bacterium]